MMGPVKNVPSQMPIQKLAHSRKDKKWKRSSVDFIVGMAEYGYSARLRDMQLLYDVYNSIFDELDIKYVTNPFHQEDGFPASAKDFNIIRPIVDTLLGEEQNRAFNYTVARTSQLSASNKIEQVKEELTNYMWGLVLSKVSPEELQRFQEQLLSGEVQTPEQIQRILETDIRDIGEEIAYNMLKSHQKRLSLKHENAKLWKDLLISAFEFIYIGEEGGEPVYRRVNPMNFTYEYNPDVEFVDQSSWCCERFRMTHTAIYDMLYDKMTEKDLDNLLEYVKSNVPVDRKSDYNHWDWWSIDAGESSRMPSDITNTCEVWHVCWKSYRKVGFLSYIDEETGEIIETTVDETYTPQPNELLEWKWITEIWEGWKVGTDIYIGIQPLPNQTYSVDNPNKNTLPYVGLAHSNSNSVPLSLVKLLLPLQEMYIVIWYRLELLIAKDRGRIPIVNYAQIPKSEGIDIDRWLHLLQSLGIYLINPDEGNEDNPRPNSFNQYSLLDLSLLQSIQQYISLLVEIENMARRLLGVSIERSGQQTYRQAVQNVELLITTSSNVTEPWLNLHSKVCERLMQKLLDVTKSIWERSDKEYIEYILDDGSRKLFSITPDFYQDMDVYVTSSTRDLQAIETIRQLYQPAVQNGASLYDIAEVLTLDSLLSIKNKLKDIETKTQQRIQEQQQMLIQAEQEQALMEAELDQAKLELARYKVDADNQTKIAVAEIGAFRFQDDLDVDNDGIPDPMQVADQALKEYDLLSRNNLDVERVNTAKKKVETDNQIAKDKLKLERDKMDNQLKLQKQKDDLAMARERIKSSTLLKNPVQGERKSKK